MNHSLQFVRALPVGVALSVWMLSSVDTLRTMCRAGPMAASAGCLAVQSLAASLFDDRRVLISGFVLTLAIAAAICGLIVSGLSQRSRPAGVTISAVYLGWSGLASLMSFALVAVATGRLSAQGPGSQVLISVVMVGVAFAGCVLLLRMDKIGWQLAVAHLCASIALFIYYQLVLTNFGFQLLYGVMMVIKLVVLAYLLLPGTRAQFGMSPAGAQAQQV